MSETTGGVHRLTAKPRLPFGKYLFGKHLWTTAIAGVAGAILLWSGAQIASRPSALPREMRMTTYTTNHGERATITLADGSSVVLNVGSQLEVPSDYAQGNRALRLTGEALFTVTPDNEAPFTVSAGPGTARVLGTSFLVRHYPMDTAAIIAVRDGKVGVRTTILTANQQAIVTTNGTLRTQAVVPSQFSFAAGILTLNDVPLTAAISELNRWYNADIRLSDPVLSAQRISGEYAAGSLTDLAAILELTFNVRVAREGRTLTLYRRIE